MAKTNISIVIVAGGTGTRMGGRIPKQFLTLLGKPILGHTLEHFHAALPQAEIVVILPKEYKTLWTKLCKRYHITAKHKVAEGGVDRTESVSNGINALTNSDGIIMIHDGVRPCISTNKIIEIAVRATTHKAVIPVVDVIDSIREITPEGNRAVDRSLYKAIQTPQAFDFMLLKKGYEIIRKENKSFSDDAAVIESMGVKVELIEGETTNIKITTPTDLIVARQIIKARLQQ